MHDVGGVAMAGSYELGSQLSLFVDDLVAAGRYNSKSEVVREGLRLLQDREQVRQIKLDELRKAFQDGVKLHGASPVVSI